MKDAEVLKFLFKINICGLKDQFIILHGLCDQIFVEQLQNIHVTLS